MPNVECVEYAAITEIELYGGEYTEPSSMTLWIPPGLAAGGRTGYQDGLMVWITTVWMTAENGFLPRGMVGDTRGSILIRWKKASFTYFPHKLTLVSLSGFGKCLPVFL